MSRPLVDAPFSTCVPRVHDRLIPFGFKHSVCSTDTHVDRGAACGGSRTSPMPILCFLETAILTQPGGSRQQLHSNQLLLSSDWLQQQGHHDSTVVRSMTFFIESMRSSQSKRQRLQILFPAPFTNPRYTLQNQRRACDTVFNS